MRLEVVDAGAGDAAAVRGVLEAAFEGTHEARIVAALDAGCDNLLSLVAVLDREIVGHILFSPVTVETAAGRVVGMGLGPMAVLPELQRRGIGSRLVAAGLDRLRAAGCPFVAVVGHPAYYPRFGFESAADYGLRSEWEIPNEAFMVLWLDPSRSAEVSGLLRYRPEFNIAGSQG